MKSLKIIFNILLTMFLFENSNAQTRAEILKFNIHQVDVETKMDSFISKSMSFYDKMGNEVRNEYVIHGFKHVTLYEYKDTLCTKLISIDYKDINRIDTQQTIFTYGFDQQGRITEAGMYNDSTLVSINKIKYNDSGKEDTVYYYRYNTTVGELLLNECCRCVYENDVTISYCYDSAGWKGSKVKITEYKKSDTLESFFVRECTVIQDEYCTEKSYTIKIYYKNGRQVKYEDDYSGHGSEDFFETNQQGLPVKHVGRSKNASREQIQTDIYTYYFR